MKRMTSFFHSTRTCLAALGLTAFSLTSGPAARAQIAPVAAMEPPTFNYFHTYYHQKRPLGLDVDRIAILQTSTDAAAGPDKQPSLAGALAAFGVAPADITPGPMNGWSTVAVPASDRSEAGVAKLTAKFAATPGVAFVSPVFLTEAGEPVLMTPHILVGFDGHVPPAQAEAALAGAGDILDRDWNNMRSVYRLRSASRNGFETLDAANLLAGQAGVKFAEPDAIFRVHKETIPNDPGFADCWGLHNTGQAGGVPDMDMDAPEAWNITTGDPNILVVVFDDGVQQDHPDLNQIPGADFTDEAPGAGGGPVNPCDHHGTLVAGCVSAKINNGLGTVGVAPNCVIASARYVRSVINATCDNSGWIYTSWFVGALTWAESSGARVTNNSNTWGFTASAAEEKYAQTRASGMVHFGSAGNNSANAINYPSSIPSVNSVAALDRDGSLAYFSNCGPGLAFSAPGRSIYTTDITGAGGWVPEDYMFAGGTSFSAPYAAGIAALVLSVNPSLNAEQVEYILRRGAMDRGAAGYDTTLGWGFLNANESVRLAHRDCNGNGVPDVLDLRPALTLGSAAGFAANTGPVGFAVADLNGDGLADLAMANLSGGATVLLNLGNGSFAAPATYAASGGPWAIAAGDLTGDGKPDLAVANAFNNNVSVLRNNGNGTFAAAVNYPAGANPWSVAIGDFTGDGKPDLAVANGGSNDVTILRNTGSGAFVPQGSFPAGAYPHSVAAADFDGDGKVDLAVANGSSGDVTVLKNSGGAVFAPPVSYPTGNGPRFVVAADFNGDGKPDLAVANEHSHNASILLNKGDGTFMAAANYTAGINPHSLAAGDLDGDGRPDLVVANRTANSLSVLRNNGSGKFESEVSYSVGGGPWPVAILHANGDGRADVLIGQYDGRAVMRLLNTSSAYSRDDDGDGVPDECERNPGPAGVEEAVEAGVVEEVQWP